MIQLEPAVRIESLPNPLVELREVREVHLLERSGAVFFCADCPGGCLKEQISEQTGVVAMAYVRREDLEFAAGLLLVSFETLGLDAALERVREEGAAWHPQCGSYLAVHDKVEGQTQTTVYWAGGPVQA